MQQSRLCLISSPTQIISTLVVLWAGLIHFSPQSPSAWETRKTRAQKKKKKRRNKRTEVPQNHKCVRLDLVKMAVCSSGCRLGMCQIRVWQYHSAKVPLQLRVWGSVSRKERMRQETIWGIQRHTINNIKWKNKRTVKARLQQIWCDWTRTEKLFAPKNSQN